MDWIGSCGLGTGNGFSLGDDNSRLIHQHISQSNRKTIFSTPTITPIFRAFLETVMKRLGDGGTFEHPTPLFFYFYLYRIEHEEFFSSSLSFCQHRTRPARDQSYKAAYCRKTDVTQRERSNSISFFPLFILRYYKPDRKKREERKSHLETTHGLIS